MSDEHEKSEPLLAQAGSQESTDAFRPDPSSPKTPSEDPETKAAVEHGVGITRRLFDKVLGLLGIGLLANEITGGALARMATGSEETEDLSKTSAEISEKIDKKAEEIAAKIEAEDEGLSEKEKMLKVVDYVGVALFAWGVRDLLPGGHGHIHALHHGVLLALTGIKYGLSDEEGRHHLKEETISNAKAFGIISGTIVAAEGLNMDIEKAYELSAGRSPEKRDKVALMTMFASVLSPIATTVGSASIIKKMSNDLCNGDPKLMSVCVSHVSNLSGFLLFGDPPFIAVCEKYGFKEGVEWQLKNMLPLALYSLFSATYKLNLFLAQKEGVQGKEAHTKAMSDTIAGLKNNLSVLVKMIAKSLGNLSKYYTGADISKKFPQDQAGIEVKIGEVIADKLENFGKLPFSPEFDTPGHGHTVPDHPAEEIAEVITSTSSPEVSEEDAIALRLRKALDDRNFAELEKLAAEGRIQNIEFFRKLLENCDEKGPTSLRDALNPINLYQKTTNVGRIKSALGHNLGDVVDVFPFQAGCVPFLTTAFKDAAKGLENVGETAKEMSLFFMIMMFSMIADNYVACKIGLEIFPDKPHIPLIAAVQGGSMTAIGNMANVAQFSLDNYTLMDSLKNMGFHADTTVMALAWSKALSVMTNLGITDVPKIKGNNSTVHAQKEPSKSRRELLFGSKRAEA